MERCPDPGLATEPFQLGGDDLRIVEDQHVTGPQKARQVAHDAILKRPVAINQQQAGSVAR